MLQKLILGLIIGITLLSFNVSALENLDEMTARSSRIPASNWGSQYLENASNYYTWQPETLMYVDSTYGTEIWKLTSSADIWNFLPDISFPQWSADGKRLVFGSKRDTGSFASGYELQYGTRMIMSADGTNLRPMPDSQGRTVVRSGYTIWSPVVPDVYYGFGNYHDGEGLNRYDLYKVTSNDITDIKELILSYPSTGGGLRIKKGISGDGTKIVAEVNEWGSPPRLFSTTVYPDNAIAIDNPNGYDPTTLPYDDYWGNLVSRNGAFHDQFLAGAGDNIWFYFLPEGPTETWMRMRLNGSGVDNIPIHTIDHTYPYDWGGEFEVLNTGDWWAGGLNDPWCPAVGDKDCPTYYSHFTPDRWGRIAAYSSVSQVSGPGTYDMENNTRIVFSFGGGAQHHDWHAWSDWFASSTEPAPDYSLQKIVTQKYDDVNSQKILASPYIASSGDYNRLARPSQSPDGTKINYHSGFLNSDSSTADLYYVVAYYPYAPKITSVNALGGTVTARFDWRLNTPNPRGYTARGWPNETTDIPPAPREIESFRLWRSPDGINWVPLGTTIHDIFTRFDFVNGGYKAGQNDFWEITDNPGEGTWYYGITSLEHSGLESRTLSNIFQVTISGGSGTGIESSVYPISPGEINTFYTTEPSAPSDLTYVATGTLGHYRLDWTEPVDSLIRYYNIYYATTPNPSPIQQNRIASVPKGTSTYLDWNAEQSSPGYYTITSIDYQGNEGVVQTTSPTCEATGTGTCYYLDANNGDDNTGDGSFNNPWKSFAPITTFYYQCLANNPSNQHVDLQAGDVVYLREGIYGQTTPIGTYNNCAANSRVVYLENIYGTAQNPITIKNYLGENAVVDAGRTTITFEMQKSAYVILDGFSIVNGFNGCIRLHTVSDSIFENLNINFCGGDGGVNPGGIMMKEVSFRNTIRNNTISNVIATAGATHNNAGIMIFEGNGHEIYNNEISDTAVGIRYKHHAVQEAGEQLTFEVYRNLLYNIYSGYGSIITGTDNARVYENILYNVATGFSTDVADAVVGYSLWENNSFFHNSVYNTDRGYVAEFNNPTEARTTIFKDNIIQGTNMIFRYDTLASIQDSDYNCYSNDLFDGAVLGGTTLSSMQALGFDLNSRITTDLFTNPSTNNFMLSSTSPCRNSASDGLHIGAWTTDNPDYSIGLFNRTSNNQTLTCPLPYDTPPTCDNCIDSGELSSTITGWFNNQINIAQLVVNIKNWKNCN